MATAIESKSSDVAVCFDTELAGGYGVFQQTSRPLHLPSLCRVGEMQVRVERALSCQILVC